MRLGIVLAVWLVVVLYGGTQLAADDRNPIATMQRIHAKAEQLKATAQARQRAGGDPSPFIQALVQFKALMDKGQSQQAEAVLDRALAATAATSAPAPSPGTTKMPNQKSMPMPIPKQVAAPTGKWAHASQAPMLDRAHPPTGLSAELSKPGLVMLWNDPSVLKQRDGYAMWAAMSPDGHPRSSAIYKLRSTDGVRWELENEGKPVFSKGEKGKDPDYYAVETPVVISVEGTYHLYYSFYKTERSPTCRWHMPPRRTGSTGSDSAS